MTGLLQSYPGLPDFLHAVERRLLELAAADLAPLAEAGHWVLGGSAKRCRPALLWLSAEACGGGGARTVEYAALIEAVHGASLAHDDVVDGAHTRRGRPSLCARDGSKLAVLVGDYLVARCLAAAAADGDVALMRLLAGAAEEMSAAQARELLTTGPALDEPAYDGIISGKTASLFACACRAGALLAGAAEAAETALDRFGRQVGMAFQLADDLADLTAPPGGNGKPANHDITTGKVTLPLIWALRAGPAAVRVRLRDLLAAADWQNGAAAELRDLVRHSGGLAYTEQRLRRHLGAAREQLLALPYSPAREALAAAADHLCPQAAAV